MADTPTRIQGTDGVRGKILMKSHDPLGDLLHRNAISPEFIELYCYTWGRMLSEESKTELTSNKVIVAQDPRDKSDQFLRAAVLGLRKAGLNCIYIGQLPTPAVPFFVLKSKALGGLMLTASHNPSDQHGIKLFQGLTGLKYLNEEEERLTSLVWGLDPDAIKHIPTQGKFIDDQARAVLIFSEWLLHEWQHKLSNRGALKDCILVVDCSKGAVSKVAASIFENLGAEKVLITNTSDEGQVNELSGVTDFEGLSQIHFDEWNSPETPWRKYKAVNLIFQLSLKYQKNAIIGLVFDGDGDRFFRLDFDPYQNCISISGGDKQVAHYLEFGEFEKPGTLVSTIETDIALDNFCFEKGFKVLKRLVGDKWVQKEVFKQLHLSTGEIDSTKLAPMAKHPAIFGFEESGHFIFPALLPNLSPARYLLTGNGIYAALVTLSLQEKMQLKFQGKAFYDYIANPYPHGQSQTYSIYYIDKSLLANLGFKAGLNELVNRLSLRLRSEGMELTQLGYSEEPDLNFWQFVHQGRAVAGLFVRNSGTEDKASVNLRVLKDYASHFIPLTESLFIYLWGRLKDQQKSENTLIFETLLLDKDTNQQAKKYPNLWGKVGGVLNQKERLLSVKGPTELGLRIKKHWGEKFASPPLAISSFSSRNQQ